MAAARRKATCATCGYWVAVGGGQTGECRLHPPQLNTDAALWEFPAVKRDSWCGDWLSKEASARLEQTIERVGSSEN